MLKFITPLVGEDFCYKTTDSSPIKILNQIESETIFECSQSYQKTIKEAFTNIYVIPSSTDKQYQFDNKFYRIAGDNANVISVKNVGVGTLCSCLLASEYWEDNDEIIISAADQFLDVNFSGYD